MHHLPVVENNRCVSLLTQVQVLRRLIAQGLVQPGPTARLTAGQLCCRPAPVVPVWTTRATAAQTMLAAGSDAVIVQDNNHLTASSSRPLRAWTRYRGGAPCR